MDEIEVLKQYFPKLDVKKYDKLLAFSKLLKKANENVNLISRNDEAQILEHHILHSLAIAKFTKFKTENKILDLGTGGGFPGIPLAIFFPQKEFILVDSIQKKINQVDQFAKALKLENITCICSRVESLDVKCDVVVTRAVAQLHKLVVWTKDLFPQKNQQKIIALKGGDLRSEIKKYKKQTQLIPISKYFKEHFFEEKVILSFAK